MLLSRERFPLNNCFFPFPDNRQHPHYQGGRDREQHGAMSSSWVCLESRGGLPLETSLRETGPRGIRAFKCHLKAAGGQGRVSRMFWRKAQFSTWKVSTCDPRDSGGQTRLRSRLIMRSVCPSPRRYPSLDGPPGSLPHSSPAPAAPPGCSFRTFTSATAELLLKSYVYSQSQPCETHLTGFVKSNDHFNGYLHNILFK